MPRQKNSELPEPVEKATKYEIERRVTTIFKLMLKGFGRGDILQYIAENDEKNPAQAWGVSDRQIENYIATANARFKEYADAQRSGMLEKAVLRLEFVYMQCIKVQDYSKAIAALRELNLLLGLHAPTKVDSTITGEITHTGAFEIKTIDYRQTALPLAPLTTVTDVKN